MVFVGKAISISFVLFTDFNQISVGRYPSSCEEADFNGRGWIEELNRHLTSNMNSTEPSNASTVYFIFLYSFLTLFLIRSKVLFLKMFLRTWLLLNISWICCLLGTFCQKVNASDGFCFVSCPFHPTRFD